MSAGGPVAREKAREIGIPLCRALEPFCEQIMFAGSIRRRAPMVHDVEIVMAPRMEVVQTGLFGDTEIRSVLHPAISDLRAAGVLAPRVSEKGATAWGKKMIRAEHVRSGMAVDLFIVTPPAQWGVILAIRTGPAELSKAFVASRLWGGLLPMGMKVQDGALVDSAGQSIDTPTERSFFEAIELPYIEPADRYAFVRAKLGDRTAKQPWKASR